MFLFLLLFFLFWDKIGAYSAGDFVLLKAVDCSDVSSQGTHQLHLIRDRKNRQA